MAIQFYPKKIFVENKSRSDNMENKNLFQPKKIIFFNQNRYFAHKDITGYGFEKMSFHAQCEIWLKY